MADALDREQRAVAQLTKAQAVAARELSAAKRAAATELAEAMDQAKVAAEAAGKATEAALARERGALEREKAALEVRDERFGQPCQPTIPKPSQPCQHNTTKRTNTVSTPYQHRINTVPTPYKPYRLLTNDVSTVKKQTTPTGDGRPSESGVDQSADAGAEGQYGVRGGGAAQQGGLIKNSL